MVILWRIARPKTYLDMLQLWKFTSCMHVCGNLVSTELLAAHTFEILTSILSMAFIEAAFK
jgi:hypothetical protein